MIPISTRRSPVYTGTGAPASYAFSFKVFSKADVAVRVTATNGSESTWVLDVNYTVALNADQDNFPGGTITPIGALPVGYKLVAVGSQAYNQTTQLPTGGAYNAVIVEKAMDRLAVMTQQLAEATGRALTLPTSEGAAQTLPSVAFRQDKLLGFDNTGQAAMSTFSMTQLASVVAAIYAAAAGPLDGLSFIQGGVAAQSRTAQDKARERVSVFDFMTAAQKADVIAGTAALDVTAAIQACIDYVMVQGGRRKVYMPAGRYRITNTLHAGYGASFQSVVIEGDGYAYRGEAQFNGTTIIADFNDRQAVNFQGARGSALRGVAILGRNYAYVMAQDLWGVSPLKDDTVVGNCYDPAFPASASSRYAPYAGVTIDAFSGAAPAVPYLGGVYGRSFSSDVLIEDCWIGGFVVGVAIQPCDADGNGDMVKLRRVNMETNTYCVSVGNSQSRNVGLEGCIFAFFHTAFVNNLHGRQIGKFNGTIDNCSFFVGTQLFDLLPAYAGPLVFVSCYAESIWKIGRYGIGNVNTNLPLSFKSCEFRVTNQNDTRGVPAITLEAGGPSIIDFDGVHCAGFPSVVTLGGNPTNYTARSLRSWPEINDRLQTYEKLAHNFLAGGFMFHPTLNTPRPAAFSATINNRYGIDSGSFNAETVGEVTFTKRDLPLCAWTRWVAPYSTPEAVVPAPPVWDVLSKVNFSTCSLVGKTLTLVISAARVEWQFALKGPYPGDVIFDDDSKSVFFVRSVNVGTKTVLAELQNNYKLVGGVYQPITPFSAVTGNLYFGNSRVYLPQYFLRGDPSTASSTISNCGRDDSFSTWIDTEILASDWLYINEQVDRFFSPVDCKVIARNGAGGTIQLGGAAARNLSVKALGCFARQPPPNV